MRRLGLLKRNEKLLSAYIVKSQLVVHGVFYAKTSMSTT